MRHILVSLGLGACALLAAAPAAAQEAGQYDYIEARYTLLGDVTNGDSDDVTGLGVESAKSLNDLVFVRVAADLHDVDNASDPAIDLFSIGPAVRAPLNTDIPVDLWAGLNYERASVTGRAATGFGLDIGVTAMFNQALRGSFMLKSATTEAGNDDVDYELWELEIAYAVNDRLDVVGALVNGEFDLQNQADFDFDNLVRVGVRMPF